MIVLALKSDSMAQSELSSMQLFKDPSQRLIRKNAKEVQKILNGSNDVQK